jgi:uncharacterized membrane protein YdcZ (DUF606 family)
VLGAAGDALRDAGVAASDLAGIGIANQRETTVLWERASGRAVAPAIVWQDRRTAARCAELPRELIRERTGLVPDPYFSATKLEWLLRAHRRPGLAFGTIDSWLAWKLTGEHVTDATNASRTLLLDLETLVWDEQLLALFGVERELLPRIAGSAEVVGEAELFGARLPLAALAGDQQAALVGEGCLAPGLGKATYGTGSFVLVHAGAERPPAPEGLLVTAAAAPAGAYAIEGAILVAGAALQWLRDGLGLIADAAESERLARSVDSTDGVYFVPALTGLGSPHWDPEARGLICGLDARDDRRAPRAGSARGDRLRGRRRRRRAAAAARAAARRRGRHRERLPDAAPGRPARLSRRGLGRAGGNGARSRRARRNRARPLERRRRRRVAQGRRALRAAAAGRPERVARGARTDAPAGRRPAGSANIGRMAALAALLALAAGLAGSMQAAVMGRLGSRVGTLEALAFSSALQALLTAVLVVAVRPGFGGYGSALRQPAWLWLGGVMGAMIVFTVTFATPRLGTAATIGILVAGQLAMGVLIDRFGLFGFEQIAISWPRAAGVVLLGVGAALSLHR